MAVNFIFNKLIPYLFYILILTVPLVLFTKTSEVFEFNKIVLTYILTILIMATWLIKMVLSKKILFRRTMLDIPLIILLLIQVITTATSIDTHTSLFGYYGRWHGGLISSFTYALLYWAYVSNMDRKLTMNSVKILLASGLIVSTYALLQRFGIDDKYWAQDVVNRVFSTIGQPNWLAAWVVSIIPVSWVMAIKYSGTRKLGRSFWIALPHLFFVTLLITKSRSGLMGFGVAYIVFWSLAYWLARSNKTLSKVRPTFVAVLAVSLLLMILFGSPWTPGLINNPGQNNLPSETLDLSSTPGGTESGDIRKLVWRGALNTWQTNPIVGTGIETFAYSFAKNKPVEHNLTSEWNFIYSKAHNEYLNYLSNSGILGIGSYLLLIAGAVWMMVKDLRLKIKDTKYEILNTKYLRVALLAGYISILATNFFGFSVVPVALNFFLFPAMAISLDSRYKIKDFRSKTLKLDPTQILVVVLILFSVLYGLLSISRYWYSDTNYAKGRSLNEQQEFELATIDLSKAIKLNPLEPVYKNELAKSLAEIALLNHEQGKDNMANIFAEEALIKSQDALTETLN